MRLSVIVPTYNRKDFLIKCMESLYNQNYPRDFYEIIVIDDGSTDGTDQVIKMLTNEKKYSNLKYLRYENNTNKVGIIRNKGIENSSGNIIAFTDSDCIPNKNWLKDIYQAFKETNVGGVYGKVEPANSNKSIILKIIAATYLRKSWEKYTMNNVALLKEIALREKFSEELETGFGEDTDFVSRCEELINSKGLRFIEIDSIVFHNIKPSFIYLFKIGFRAGYGYLKFNKIKGEYIKSKGSFVYLWDRYSREIRHFGAFIFPFVSLLIYRYEYGLLFFVSFIATIGFFISLALRSCKPLFPYIIFSPFMYAINSGGFIIGLMKRLLKL